MIKLTINQLNALSEVMERGHPYEVLLEQVDSVRLNSGETLTGGNLLVATMLYDDQRDGQFSLKFLIGSALTGGKALQIK